MGVLAFVLSHPVVCSLCAAFPPPPLLSFMSSDCPLFSHLSRRSKDLSAQPGLG